MFNQLNITKMQKFTKYLYLLLQGVFKMSAHTWQVNCSVEISKKIECLTSPRDYLFSYETG